MAFRILLIEDDVEIADFVTRGLREEGFTVVHAADGVEGAHRMQTEAWDLVLLDWWLPGVDGLTLLKQYRQKDSNTPVLLLTGWGQRLVADDEVPAHIDRVLSKPPRIAQLRAALVEVHSHAADSADNTR